MASRWRILSAGFIIIMMLEQYFCMCMHVFVVVHVLYMYICMYNIIYRALFDYVILLIICKCCPFPALNYLQLIRSCCVSALPWQPQVRTPPLYQDAVS